MFLTTRSALVLGLVSLPLAASSTVPVLDIHYIFPSERKFKLKEDIVGHKFYDAFNFQTFNDPTHGRVDYVDQSYASSRNLTYTSDSKFVMRADTSKVVTKQSRGRESIRIASKQKYEDSVIVLDMTHMPTGCATWPAFWTVTSEGRWPKGGEIDIIEGVNLQSRNLASLHTTAGCTMSEYRPRLMTGKAKSNECDASKNYNQGCGVDFSRPKSYGKDFNKYGGGWFAMSRTKEDGISVWFWSRDDPTVPDDVRRGGKTVCTDTWGLPEAVFTPDNCDMKSHFGPHEIVFDLTFCGDWAGSLYPTSGCPGSCVDFVDNNPKEFLDAYWEINSLPSIIPSFAIRRPRIGVMITVAHPTTARHSILGKRTLSSPSMDGPKQGVLRLKSLKEKENLSPSSLPRLAVRKDPNQPSPVPVRKVSGSQPTLGAAALRTQVDTLRAENAKLRKDHQRELAKLQEKSSQSEVRIQELVREKLLRESEQAEAEREHRMAASREAALRTALERSEAALKQMNERTSKISGAERKLEDMERIHNDEKRKLTLEITSLQSQLEVARTTLNDHSARLRERDASKRFESRARDLEARLQERESRIRELEEELATAEAQAQVYEGRVQVYDKRVRAYKERVRIAESQAREAESEIEALQVARAMGDEEKAEELDYAKGLMERLAAAYGELNERMQERDREVRSLEWALSDKEERARALERSLRMAEEERRELMEELDARRALSGVQEWSRPVVETSEKDPRVELDELLTIAMDGQREAREMELEKLQVLARDLPRDVPPPPTPSTSASKAELELARLREECAALREEQESLEQDLVDAAMEAEGHARQAASFAQLSADYATLEAELARARAESAQPNTSAAHAQAQADLVRLESEHQRLKEEFTAYKSSMEDTARAAAEHEARAVLLNGLQAREFSLREQMGTLEAKIAKLEAVVEEERRKLSRAEEKLVEARAVEDGLRDDMDEMMEALDRVDRYEEAYDTLVKEIVQLGLGDDDLDRLEKMTEGILNVSTAKQKMKYVDQVKMDLDRMAQASPIPLKLARTEYERDQARAQGVDLHRELSVFKTVTGLNGWNNPARASSTPPVRNAMTPPARAPSTPLERITERPVANPGPSSGARPELRALGLGRPPARPRSVMTTTSSNERRISRALSFALEAENMTLEE